MKEEVEWRKKETMRGQESVKNIREKKRNGYKINEKVGVVEKRRGGKKKRENYGGGKEEKVNTGRRLKESGPREEDQGKEYGTDHMEMHVE
ncbi:hypothetical protein KI387_034773, partial [Taxus chinensis]